MDPEFVAYVELVRKRLYNNDKEVDKFRKFLRVFKEFKSQKISGSEFLPRLKELLIGHPDLIARLIKFVPEEFHVTVAKENAIVVPTVKKKKNDKMAKMEKARKFLDKFRSQKHVYKALKRAIRVLEKGEKRRISRNYRKVREKCPDLSIEFTRSCVTKPEKKPIPPEGEVRRLESQSTTFRGGVKEISAFEKRAFALEDERNDYDVLLNALKLTAKRVGSRLVALMKGCEREELSAVNLRYIEKLYGEYGLEVLDHVRANPKKALQIIFRRLWQKVFELEKFRFVMDKRLRHGLMQD
ncbi:hypothetical protein LguiA_013452 [Lonicera macranthoides]